MKTGPYKNTPSGWETLPQRFREKVRQMGPDECWCWTGATSSDGYGRMTVEGGRRDSGHRVAFMLHHGLRRIRKDRIVMHDCDNPSCCNPRHLRLGTHNLNMKDKVAKGRQACIKGEERIDRKLSNADVLAIRASSETGIALGKRYGVSNALIGMIRKRKKWKHL